MIQNIEPLNARRFKEAVLDYLSPAKRNKIYDLLVRDHMEKLELIDAGYGLWLQRLLPYLVDHYQLPGKRIWISGAEPVSLRYG